MTIHDAVPWSHPETLTPRGAAWHRAMAKRAERYADAFGSTPEIETLAETVTR